jgi:protein-S-isoprenylcysteine O-methyltransferase Ste14
MEKASAIRLILFILLSLPVIALSWRTLFRPRSHGFYRFFSWESIIWLFASNYSFWFVHPFSPTQIISWVFLLLSGYLVAAGVIRMKKKGKPGPHREEPALYGFEKTTELVDTGVFRYIRHPLYSSLLFLTWGIFFKHPSGLLFLISLLSTLCLYLTAKAEEKECLRYFGPAYTEYMKHSRMFIPFLF